MAAILGGVPAEHHGVPQAPPVGILAPCLKKPEPQLSGRWLAERICGL